RMQKAISRSALVQFRAVEICEQIRKEIEDLDAFVDLGADLEEDSAAYAKRRNEVKNKLAEIVTAHKKMGKCARSRVEVSKAIRNVPFYNSQWKAFGKEIERVVDEMSHLDQELRKPEGRSSQTAQAKARELKR